jgi:hypothetical protein
MEHFTPPKEYKGIFLIPKRDIVFHSFEFKKRKTFVAMSKAPRQKKTFIDMYKGRS